MSTLLQRKKNALVKRDGGFRCFYCHIPLEMPPAGIPLGEVRVKDFRSLNGRDYATIDHLRAQANGGNDKLENLVLCCLMCNWEKDKMSWQSFYQKKRGARKNR